MTRSPATEGGEIFDLIEETEREGLLLDQRAAGLAGLSGAKTVGLLQRLARRFEGTEDCCYLEIGVFQGLTLVSAASAAPELPCFGIDNFATLDPLSENRGIVEDRISRFGTENAHLIDSDFETALLQLDRHIGPRRVGVYLVDGPHDYRSQLICLLFARPFLHHNAVIVIDDANYPDVRWATNDFLTTFPEFKLAFDGYSTGHPANLDSATKALAEEGWLNGIHVIIRDPDDELDTMLAPTSPAERNLYLTDWLTHRLRYAELGPEALVLADNVLSGAPAQEGAARAALREAFEAKRTLFEGRYADRNVYSAALPSARPNRKR